MSDDPQSNPDSGPPSDWGRHDVRTDELDTDEILRLLASERRRHLLSFLSARGDEPVSTDELVDAVVERDRPDPGPASHRERIEIDLHHVHLPKLADVGVITFDPVTEMVSYVGPAELEAFLDASTALDDRGDDTSVS